MEKEINPHTQTHTHTHTHSQGSKEVEDTEAVVEPVKPPARPMKKVGQQVLMTKAFAEAAARKRTVTAYPIITPNNSRITPE